MNYIICISYMLMTQNANFDPKIIALKNELHSRTKVFEYKEQAYKDLLSELKKQMVQMTLALREWEASLLELRVDNAVTKRDLDKANARIKELESELKKRDEAVKAKPAEPVKK